MAKNKPWTEEEIRTLEKLLDERKSHNKISKVLGRSVNAIKITLFRKLNYRQMCIECGERVNPVRGHKSRCPECSTRVIEEKKKIYNQSPRMKAFYKRRNDLRRYGGLREKVIIRDKEKCVDCGMTRAEQRLKWNIDLRVRFKDGKGRYKDRNMALDNMETVCSKCQGIKDEKYRRKDWSMTGNFLREWNKNKPRSLKLIRQQLEKLDEDLYLIKEVKKDKYILIKKSYV